MIIKINDHENKHDAVMAYKQKAKELFGEFASF